MDNKNNDSESAGFVDSNQYNQPIPPTPNGFGVIQDQQTRYKQSAPKTSRPKKIADFFNSPWRKLALILVITVMVLGGGVIIYKDQYQGTAKESGAASTTEFDVLVYDDTTSGYSAISSLATTAKANQLKINVLWLKQNTAPRAMAVNGLNIEDLFEGPIYESGTLKVFRKAVDTYHKNTNRVSGKVPYLGYYTYKNGVATVAASTRQVFTNSAARYAFDVMLNATNTPTVASSGYGVTVTTAYGYPNDYNFNVNTGNGVVSLANGQSHTAKYFIDASIEADLARLMGANYKLGLSEKVYNDKLSISDSNVLASYRKSQYNELKNCDANDNYGTATNPDSTNCIAEPVTALLTLKKSTTKTTKNPSYIDSGFSSAYTNPDTNTKYDSAYLTKQFKGYDYLSGLYNGRAPYECNIDQMLKWPTKNASGTMLYEFNQHWDDYRIPEGIFDWYMYPQKRPAIAAEITDVAKRAVNYLNNRCTGDTYAIDEAPKSPYIRGEMRIQGLTTMTTTGAKTDSIAIGYYNPFDRRAGDYQVASYPANKPSGVNTQYAIEVPYSTLVPNSIIGTTNSADAVKTAGLKNLLISTAISTDWKTYNTSVRMEATRMYMGEAAGTAIALAFKGNIDANKVPSNTVQYALKQRGTKLFIIGDVNSRTAAITTSTTPTVTTVPIDATGITSPVVTLTGATNQSVGVAKLSATVNSATGTTAQLAFRIRKGSDCNTALTSSGPWSALAASGSTHSYTFTGLKAGTYYWSAKARDSQGIYSNGLTFCGSTGWAPAKVITVK